MASLAKSESFFVIYYGKCGKIYKIMKTEIVFIDENNIDRDIIDRAGDIIKRGGLVAFPTETVYGLGGDALNRESSRKIYAAKGRPSDNPLIVHIADMEALDRIVSDIPASALKLADYFWPGPLTMIFFKSDAVPYDTTGGLDTVAVRMPVDSVARAFIRASGGYVAAPSANISGRPSPTSARFVEEDMDGRIDMIIKGDDSRIGLESTIVDITSEKPMILRPGYITKEMLEEVVGEVTIDPTILDAACTDRPKAPGMRYRHYAPKGDLTVVKGPEDEVVEYINLACASMESSGKKVGVIATGENVSKYSCANIKCVGSRTDEKEIAHRLYGILREFDDEDMEVIYSEAFDEGGLGGAIMNRLLKAAGHQVIDLRQEEEE